mmetsp:Transcript_12365/g.21790  ORF Transcript_12365/g.21790 Transcript_12365/m.21790 type:complete len:241 (-) Transcript_12365:264-986(-)
MPLAWAMSRWVVARLARSWPTTLDGRLARLRAWLMSICASFWSWRIWLLICSSVRTAVSVFCTKLVGSNTMSPTPNSACAGCAMPKASTQAVVSAARLWAWGFMAGSPGNGWGWGRHPARGRGNRAADRPPNRGCGGAAMRLRTGWKRKVWRCWRQRAPRRCRAGPAPWMRPRRPASPVPGRGRTGDCRGGIGSSSRAWAARWRRSRSGASSAQSLRRSCESAARSPAGSAGRCGSRSFR